MTRHNLVSRISTPLHSMSICIMITAFLRAAAAASNVHPPANQTRRVLEYVTLANAFCLLLSLAWLHSHFVNPKGQGSAVSCLPAALARAGVDPAHLHVLQVRVPVVCAITCLGVFPAAE